MSSLVVIILLLFCAIGLVLVSYSLFKSICDDPPRNRSAPAAATTTNSSRSSAAMAASVAAANSNGGNVTADGAASQDVISRLPVFVYSSATQKKKLNCSVCLTDFKEGEKGRFLPRCFHCFHVECIDMWLTSHLVCPICRASVDPQAPELTV